VRKGQKKRQSPSILFKRICKNCGKVFYTTVGSKRYCKTNCKKVIEAGKRLKEKQWKHYCSDEKLIECKCPCCGIIHERRKFYTGSLKTPLFLCEKCEDLSDNFNEDYLYNSHEIMNSKKEEEETEEYYQCEDDCICNERDLFKSFRPDVRDEYGYYN
jgi:hypothetical protein